MTAAQIKMLIPVVIYIAVCVWISISYGNKQMGQKKVGAKHRFSNNFFIGGRTLGGVVLAMTTMATYYEASSYFGGPGQAFTKGLAWVYLAQIQAPLTFLILGTYGKKFGMVARKINAVTIPDYLRHRFKSEALVWVAAIAMIVFFESIIIANLLGGAILLQSITGIPYLTGLIIFTVIIVIYTAIGGFKAVAIGDTIQGFVMIAGAVVLLIGIYIKGGGAWAIKETMDATLPFWADAVTPLQSKVFTMSFWVLVGYACVGLPQTGVRNMSFRDTKSLHDAMIVSTIVMGLVMLVTHFCGVLSNCFISIDQVPTTDSVVPTVATMILPNIVAGIFIAGCMAAVMSTVAGVLVNCVSSVVKDIWLHKKEVKDPDYLLNKENERKYKNYTLLATAIFAVIGFVLAINPPSMITWLNLFATGGLACVFLMPIIGGLYCKKGNKVGAMLSAVGGFASFLIFDQLIPLGDVNASVPGVAITIILFFVGNKFGKQDLTAEEMEVYFPTK